MIDPSQMGRFEQSFIVRMVKEFFLLLLIVVMVELTLRFALLLYDVSRHEVEVTTRASQQLADDVRNIMVNSGGPVAARTLYPILRQNHAARGLFIAIEPSEVTVRSIEKIFSFRPKGVPADWPEGRHHSATVPIEAEKFCLRCHVEARVGDVLGTVTVRDYFADHLASWWREVRLTAAMSLFKILLSTMLLYLLLKARLEPVQTLRAVVGDLARGSTELSRRAPVRSADEFGALANDLNRYLDRLTHVIQDLADVLARIGDLNTRLEDIREKISNSFEGLANGLAKVTDSALAASGGKPLLSREWLQIAGNSRRLALEALPESSQSGALRASLEELFSQLEDAVTGADDLVRQSTATRRALGSLSNNTRDLARHTSEMAVLEEKMQAIAATGQKLVERLLHSPAESSDDGADH